MSLRFLLLVLLLVSGCVSTAPESPPPGHPASPGGAEVPWVPPPDRLTGPIELDPAEAPAEGTWTCPMHPEVRTDAPGACPKCGMDLVPVKEEHDHK